MTAKIPQTIRYWQERWERWMRPHYPRTVLALESNRVTGLRLVEGREKKRRFLSLDRWAETALPAEAWRASFTRPNLADPDRVRAAAAEVLERLGVEPGDRIAVLLPDSVARVNLLSFPELPLRRRDIEPLVRFRLQKTIPFRMEDAVLVYHVLGAGPQGERQILAVILLRAVLNQYEELFRSLDVSPGLVDLSSINLLNLCRGDRGPELPAGVDWLLVNVTNESLTLQVVRDGEIRFYRCKAHPAAANGATAETALREIRSSLAYYRERLGGRGLARCFLRASCDLPVSFWRGVVEAAGVQAERLDPLATLEPNPEGVAPSDDEAQRLVPLIGMALGRRE